MEKYRKRIIISIIICLVILICGGCSTKDDGIRLRIIANSDSEIDQKNKLEVKAVLEDILLEKMTFDTEVIEVELKTRITKAYVNTIKVECRKENFPAKAYHGKFMPSGYYDTIVITIGKGEGKNFWTILYPDFFKISFDDDNEIEYRSYIYDKIKNK